MISFHTDTANIGKEWAYAHDFRWAPVSDFSRLANGISTYAWGPCRWAHGHRHGLNFLEAHLFGLDFDNGAMTLEDAANVFCDSTHIIGTTKSHGVEKNGRICDRFRVILKFERPLSDPDVYRATVAHYINKYDCDPACKDAGRFFWPCREIVSVVADGYAQELKAPVPRPVVDYSIYREFKQMPRWIEGVIKFGAPPGKRNTTCMKVGKYLTLCGFAPEEIVALIRTSPIDLAIEEIEAAVRNGVEYGKAELIKNGRKEAANT